MAKVKYYGISILKTIKFKDICKSYFLGAVAAAVKAVNKRGVPPRRPPVTPLYIRVPA
jgi:hypothetical protein